MVLFTEELRPSNTGCWVAPSILEQALIVVGRLFEGLFKFHFLGMAGYLCGSNSCGI